jgi:hypothetical protein
MKKGQAMWHMKKLVGLCVALMVVMIGSIAVATLVEAGTTKIIKSKESGSFISANFDPDHTDLSTRPATSTARE